MEITIQLMIIALASLFIFFLGNRFALSSSRIGDHLQLHRSIKGATFDAIASSMPELMVALFAVIFFNSFEIGIGTIAGSALFNLLVIPGIAVLVAPVAFTVTQRVITRDALFYVISVFILVVLTFYFKVWGFAIAIILLTTYGYYLQTIRFHSKKDREEAKAPEIGVRIGREVGIAFLLVVLMGVVTYFLTDSSINLAELLGISPVIVAFVLIAAATSLPDAVISIVNARKGDIDDAASNVFGSNTFDILVGLGLPILIFNIIDGPVEIIFDHIEILFGLLGATIVVLHFFAEDHTLEKSRGVAMLALYVLFILYVVFIAFKDSGAVALLG